MPTPPITPRQINRYHEEGYLVVPGLYEAEEIVDWKERIISRLRKEGNLDDPTGVRVWMVGELGEWLRAQMLEHQVVAILKCLIAPNVEFLSVKAVFKNSETRFGSPWHHDWFYWRGSNKISVWIALDDVTPENGCLKVVPGSHRNVYEVVKVKEAIGFQNRVEESSFADLPPVALPVERGGAVFFHDRLLHASYPNTAGADRWSLISTYRNAEEKDESTVWKTSIRVRGETALPAPQAGPVI
jgi:ectoine hydroxylase-related dioxygenase (phytanoyl-CoA dioxygenase family)